MRTTPKLTALAFFLLVNGTVHANDNPAQHSADCIVKASFAKSIMENRLDGITKSQAMMGPEEAAGVPDKTVQMTADVIEKTYEYDISNGSVEAFQDEILQECMAEG